MVLSQTWLSSWPRLGAACLLAAAIPAVIGYKNPTMMWTEGVHYQLHGLRYQPGDTLAWGASDYDDQHWIPSGASADVEGTEYWVRFGVEVMSTDPPRSGRAAIETPARDRTLRLALLTTFAYDVYWNGQLVGTNLPVGYRIDDVGVDVDAADADAYAEVFVPATLVRSANTVALRARTSGSSLLILNYALGGMRSANNSTGEWVDLMAAGCYAALGIVFGLLFLTGPQRPSHRLFFVMLVLAAVSSLAVYGVSAPGVLRVTQAGLAIAVLLISAFSLVLLVPLLLAVELGFPAKGVLTGVFILGTTVSFAAPNGPHPYLIGGSLALGVATWGLVRGVPESRLAMVGVSALGASLVTELVLDARVTDLGFLLMILVMNVSLITQARDRRVALEASRVRSARLESELLKRIIQPHYLLNSLNALAEVLEEHPTRAGELLGALTDEFQLIGRVSNQPVIPLEEEMRMCQAHLTIMGHRHDRSHTLTVTGARSGLTIPPGVFHTLVENGTTHDSNGAALAFRLECTEDQGEVVYRLWCGSERSVQRPPGSDRRPDGTGLRYVRARLTEAYGDRWRLEGRPVDGGWETILRVPAPEER